MKPWNVPINALKFYQYIFYGMSNSNTTLNHFWERLPPSKKNGRLQGRGYLFDDAGGKMSLMWLLLVGSGLAFES